MFFCSLLDTKLFKFEWKQDRNCRHRTCLYPLTKSYGDFSTRIDSFSIDWFDLDIINIGSTIEWNRRWWNEISGNWITK